jgi:uncharacterized membrane protein YtjA (UPF0391 family)
MLGWAIAFLVAALAVGVLGVEVPATTLAAMSKVLFFVFLAGMILSLALHFNSRKRI